MRNDSSFAPDPDMLDRYLAGELSAHDAKQIGAWMDSRGDRRVLVDVLRSTASASGHLERPVDVERGLRLLWGTEQGEQTEQPKQLDVERARHAVTSKASVTRHVWSRALWYTGAGLSIGAIGLVTGLNVRTGLFTSAAPATTTYATGSGQRANITLSDGTTVVLNVASRLEVPADYATGNHTVTLHGAGYFIATHHSGAPFTVISGMTTIRVLGTSFMVRQYDADTTAIVAVRTGRVSVHSNSANTIVLAANQQFKVSRTDNMSVTRADAAQFSFASGELALNDRSLADAIPDLNRWYDVDIRLGDPTLTKQRMTANLPAGSAADLVALLQLTFNVRVVRDGRVLTLFPSGE